MSRATSSLKPDMVSEADVDPLAKQTWEVAVKYFGKAMPERPDSAASWASLQTRGVPEEARQRTENQM